MIVITCCNNDNNSNTIYIIITVDNNNEQNILYTIIIHHSFVNVYYSCHIYTYMYIHACIYIYIYLCMYIYIYIETCSILKLYHKIIHNMFSTFNHNQKIMYIYIHINIYIYTYKSTQTLTWTPASSLPLLRCLPCFPVQLPLPSTSFPCCGNGSRQGWVIVRVPRVQLIGTAVCLELSSLEGFEGLEGQQKVFRKVLSICRIYHDGQLN